MIDNKSPITKRTIPLKNYDDLVTNDSNLKKIGHLQIARYNPPWTLPFFRRNELMVKIN